MSLTNYFNLNIYYFRPYLYLGNSSEKDPREGSRCQLLLTSITGPSEYRDLNRDSEPQRLPVFIFALPGTHPMVV